MSKRNWFFGVIVAVVVAAQFTLSAFWLAVTMFQTDANGSLRLEDPQYWVHLGFLAVVAVVLWGVAVRVWGRLEGNLPVS